MPLQHYITPRSGTSSAAAFFTVVFATTWLFQLPWLLARYGVIAGPAERFMPLVVLGFFGPTLLALAFSVARGGRAGLRELFAQLVIWRVPASHYLLALGLSPFLYVFARALFAPVGQLGPWFYPPHGPQIGAMLIIPFTEQIAWRGYAYPALLRAHGALRASLIMGGAWALFHAQKHLFLLPAPDPTVALLSIVFMTAGTVVFSWIQLRARGSLLVVVIAHMGVYLNNPVDALPGDVRPLMLHTLAFCALAMCLVVFDREGFHAGAHASAGAELDA
jgi:membrane protease YdiL (CAAX protease family)